MSLVLLIAELWLATADGLTIRVQRSWLLGQERSACTLQPSDVVKLLGQPDSISRSGWNLRLDYQRIGFYFCWESPGYFICLAGNGPEAMAVLRTITPARARPLMWLLAKAEFWPRESLVAMGWSVWQIEFTWRCDPQ
jgi:hypothetical protein